MESEVSRNLAEIFERRRAAAFALCLEYAGLVLAEFRRQQMTGAAGRTWAARYSGAGQGRYWTNRTETAARTVFADAYLDDDEMGFFIAHMVEYGVYLELANNRKHEALRPIIEEFFPRFRKDLAAIYGEVA